MMGSKIVFFPKSSVHKLVESMKNTDLEGGYTKRKCLSLLGEQIYRFFSSGKTVNEIMEIVNAEHNIITRADVTKIIAQYANEPDERDKHARRPRKKTENMSHDKNTATPDMSHEENSDVTSLSHTPNTQPPQTSSPVIAESSFEMRKPRENL